MTTTTQTRITDEAIDARAFDLMEAGKAYTAADLVALRDEAARQLQAEAEPVHHADRIAAQYGVQETNGLANGAAYHAGVDYAAEHTLAQVAAAHGRITRVRVLTDRYAGVTMCDVSYIHATLPDGKVVPVRLGDNIYGCPLTRLRGDFIAWAKAEGVFAKGIGLLDEMNWSVLR